MATSGSEARAIRAYSFLVAFANDGSINSDELEFIKKLMLRDGIVDEQERSVLSAILGRVNRESTSAEDWAELVEFKQTYGID